MRPGLQSFTSYNPVSNEAAGAADASRATLRESCRTKGSCIAIFAFA